VRGVRIARVITRLNVGGPAIQAITLSERLTAQGFDTLLVHGRLGPSEGDMSYLQTDATLPTRFIDSLRRHVSPAHDLVALARLYALFCRFKPALVHTHMAKAGTLGRLAAVLYNRTAGRRTPARIVHTYHGHVLDGYFSRRSTAVVLGVERALARHTDAIVAISTRIRDELLETYGIGSARQYRVVPLGFDLDAFTRIDDAARQRARETMDVPAGAVVVTTVGRLTAIKQHDLFLRMAALVARHHPDAVFLIAGDGELRPDLERTARDLELGARIRFLGWRRDLANVYAATDVFVLTSRNEGTPVALIESMAAGVPGVSTDVGGVRDVIRSTTEGIVVPRDDGEELAKHVGVLLADPDRRRAIGIHARKSVIARYAIDRLLSDVSALYRQLISTPEHQARASGTEGPQR
jgi:glycosyltransferase involved in cell wall biosynthesis